MSIICADIVTENYTHLYTSFYTAAAYLEKELHLVCFTPKCIRHKFIKRLYPQ